MTRSEIRDIVLRALMDVAPEIDAAALRTDVPLRDQVDIDSMDFLRFVVALHTQTRVEVPEADYGQLATIDGAVDYIAARATASSPAAR